MAIKKKRAPIKKVSKKRVRRPAKTTVKKTKEKIIGKVTHYFPHVKAAVVKLKVPLEIGDVIRIKGHTTAFTQTVTSLQINHLPTQKARKGQEIGIQVDSRVRRKDIVYKA